MRIFAALVLLAASAATRAAPVEVWECRGVADSSEPVLVSATVDAGRSAGNISVAGVTHAAAFRVLGFNRRWDFGPQSRTGYPYAFVIEPNGDATYYEIGESGKEGARNFMKCAQSDRQAQANAQKTLDPIAEEHIEASRATART